MQTECVSARISLGVLFYIAKKFSSQHFGGGGVEPVNPAPLKYGPGFECFPRTPAVLISYHSGVFYNQLFVLMF